MKESTKNTIKFNMYNITKGDLKVKVSYALTETKEGKKAIWISEKNYGYDLMKIFSNAKNNTDTMTDYFDYTSLYIIEGEKYFEEALEACNRKRAKSTSATTKIRTY